MVNEHCHQSCVKLLLLASKIWVGESSDWWNVGKEWICSGGLGFKTFRIVRLAKHDFRGYFNWDGTDNSSSVNQNSPICKWLQGEEVPYELELIGRDNFYRFLSWSIVLYWTAFISSGCCCNLCWWFFFGNVYYRRSFIQLELYTHFWQH